MNFHFNDVVDEVMSDANSFHDCAVCMHVTEETITDTELKVTRLI